MKADRQKRANGDGSIYRSSDGTWRGALSIGNGQRRFFSGRRRDQVARKVATAARDQRAGLPLPSGTETVASYLARWLDGTQPTIRTSTWTRYEQYLRIHAIPVIGRIKLSRLSPLDLQDLYQNRLRTGCSPTSVQHLHAVLHHALVQADRWGLVARNVADLVDPPRIPRREMRVLNAAEVGMLLEAASGDRLRPLYLLAVTTGMREGELLALKWADLDLNQGKAFIRRTVGRVPGKGMLFHEAKTARSARCVQLTTTAVRSLIAHKAAQAGERLATGPEWTDLDLVFPNPVGCPIDNTNLLRREFYPLLRRASLPRVPFHNLRHTAATLLLERGVHPKVVSEMLGHTNISTTLDLYSHVTETMQLSAAAEMDAVIKGWGQP